MNLKNVVDSLKIEANCFCTENIAFRLFTRSDAFPLYQATLNPEFNKKLAWGPPESFDDVVVQTDLLLREMTSNQSVVLSVVEKETGAWIGLIKFSIYRDSLIQSAWFHPNYWKSPITMYASSASIDFLFKASNLKNMYAKYIIGHPTMEKIVLRNGFKYIGKDTIPHTNGEIMECNAYELTYENWQGNSKTEIKNY